jgi:hypothetical protein
MNEEGKRTWSNFLVNCGLFYFFRTTPFGSVKKNAKIGKVYITLGYEEEINW